MSIPGHSAHGPDELCAAGQALYEEALRESRIPREEAAAAPCLTDGDPAFLAPGLDPDYLVPRAPAEVMAGRLAVVAREIAERSRSAGTLYASMAPFLTAVPQTAVGSISLVEPRARVNEALDEALTDYGGEVLTMQNRGWTPPSNLGLAAARKRMNSVLDAGGSFRTVYPEVVRDEPQIMALQRAFRHRQVRVVTVPEVIDRTIIVGREVAWIPASEDSAAALEIRYQPLIAYVTKVFNACWERGRPLFGPDDDGVTATGVITRTQRRILRLLVNGHPDKYIASKLSMRTDTVRAHIGRLHEVVGSSSRVQLGYLACRAGLLVEDEEKV